MNSAFTRTAEELLSRTTALLARHPRRISAAIAALLLTGTGFTFAVANLAPDASQLPVRSISENIRKVLDTSVDMLPRTINLWGGSLLIERI